MLIIMGKIWKSGVFVLRIVSLAEVNARLSAYIEQARKEGPVVITRNGQAVAVLLAPEDDDDLESLLMARSPRFNEQA